MIGVARSTVKESLAFWKATGAVHVETGGGRGRASAYRIPAFANPKKGPLIGCFGEQKRADLASKKGPIIGPQHLREEHLRAGAREDRISIMAEKLADSVARLGERAVVLDGWRARDVAELAVELHGADRALLRRLGCDIASTATRAAP